jgi:hypothetical protein
MIYAAKENAEQRSMHNDKSKMKLQKNTIKYIKKTERTEKNAGKDRKRKMQRLHIPEKTHMQMHVQST